MKTKGLTADIYRSKYSKCKLNKLNNFEHVTIVDDEIDEIFAPSESAPEVRLIKRNINGNTYIHAIPAEKGCYMFGGSFIYTSDSRVRSINKYPIPLHDREEF